jgi:UDP-glucose 4-epimerase
MKSVLITGGAGFIGSHIADAYLERGWRVRILDDLSSGVRENVEPRAELVVGDLRDPRAIEEALDGGVDVINHHAAQMDVRRSVADPAFDADVNVVGALRLLQRAVDSGVRKVVFASSGGAIYGEPDHAPQDESHPTRPMSPYGCSKFAFEQYLAYYSAIYGISATSLRYGNVYGPRQRKDGEAGVVAIFAGRIFAGEEVTINGSGEQTRDYVFVGDVVKANLAVSENDLTGAFNVGTGIETSVNGLFGAMLRVTGSGAEAQHGEAKKGEQMRSVLDGTRLRTAASLPEPVPLEEGLAVTLASMRPS